MLRSVLLIVCLFFIYNVSFGQFNPNYKSNNIENNKGTSIGLMVGEPIGLTLKSWRSKSTAFDIGVAWSFGRYDAVSLHADHLWHNLSNSNGDNTLFFYYGLGARLVLGDNDSFIGGRFPAGINYLLNNSSFGIFLEVAPIINLIPTTDFDIDGNLGFRIYI